MIYTQANWKEFLEQRDRAKLCEIDIDIFEYFLEVLPPIYMHKQVNVPGRGLTFCVFGFAEGKDYITAFFCEGKGESRRYFCQLTDDMNPNW